ncbi:hypothetical protein AQUCO_03300066v1 [Aquilegia coerulea]|uniref:S-protein homolog n=1 Tax=Aquilegia coerulea TaxID=218851 RepID=A0A2G5CZB0_AQUCA|nr:hypothetical protein AQUCO_03300066v1 [Aquilegia coerulea]
MRCMLFHHCSLVFSLQLFRIKHVEVWNRIVPNSILKLHCKSRDDDLGEHFIPLDKSWEWKFQVNFILHSTLFWCNMEWQDPVTKSVLRASFDAYNARKESEFVNNCNRCAWVARQDGIYHSPPLNQWRPRKYNLYYNAY